MSDWFQMLREHLQLAHISSARGDCPLWHRGDCVPGMAYG